ncbi:hypothetical protein [uncultured Polaribacter sp.]|uniref:hypothetical protein n=1 Tax=uncultured Polaribacter sp. TaxID=174711 RepID=UPI00260D71CD|nr:hypothetical protein [uncultured Polaribacter sp.]
MKKKKNSFSNIFKSSDFLEDVDFSSSKYALYIRHKKHGEFMVLNQELIEENKNDLKVKTSFINYLPGEGDRGYGVRLFKNNKLVKSKLGGVFKKFEIGTLNNHKLPIKRQRISGTKKVLQQKLDSIKNEENIFITHLPTFVADNRAFRFRVYFPSIAIPVKREIDNYGYERVTAINGDEIKKWSNKLKKCIKEKADSISDFDVSITHGSLGDAYIFDTTAKWGAIRTSDRKFLYTKDYIYYNFTAYIKSDKESSEKLLSLDYSDCLSEIDRNKPQVIAKMKELLKQSTKPNLSVDNGEVGLEGYKDKVTKYKTLYEQEYSLNWLELENK